MNLKIALMLGAGIILSLTTIVIAFFFNSDTDKIDKNAVKYESSIKKNTENLKGNLILQKKPLVSQPVNQQGNEQKQIKPEQPQTAKKSSQPVKSKPRPTKSARQPIRLSQQPAKPAQQQTTSNNSTVNKEGGNVATDKTAPAKTILSEKNMQLILNELLSSATSTPQILITPTATSSPPKHSQQEIFEKSWPKEYIEHLRQVEDKMIEEGFKDADDRNSFATNEDMFKFINSTITYLYSKNLFTANEWQSLQNIFATMEATMKSPTFAFPTQSEQNNTE